MPFIVNTAFTLTDTIRDDAGALFDPASVTGYAQRFDGDTPIGSEDTIAFTKLTTGIWTGLWTPLAGGTWKITVKSTDPAIHSRDIQVTVLDSFHP